MQSGAEREVLERILSYGPAAGEIPETGHLQLVVPRPGTISPWSSKRGTATRGSFRCERDSTFSGWRMALPRTW